MQLSCFDVHFVGFFATPNVVFRKNMAGKLRDKKC